MGYRREWIQCLPSANTPAEILRELRFTPAEIDALMRGGCSEGECGDDPEIRTMLLELGDD